MIARFGGNVMHRARQAVVFTILIPWVALLQPAPAAPYPVEMEARLRLELQPMAVTGDETRVFESRTVEILPDEGGSIRLELNWPEPERSSIIDLHFSGTPAAGGPVHQVRVQSSVTIGGDEPVVVDRWAALDENSLRFVEIFARDDRHLTLALKIEEVLRPVILQPSGKDLPVEFRLAISRVMEQGVTLLETNTLRTFIGRQVSYSFRRGEGDDFEEVRLDLTPLQIQGNLLRLRIDLQGEMRTGASPLFLNRSETVLTGRSTINEFEVVSGEPPLGYRFTVTPLF